MTHESVPGRYILKTLGCKANLYDSQLIEAELRKRGWRPLGAGDAAISEGPADVPVLCVVNSCTVTDEADRQSRKMAARLARENENSFVVVTGCSAEVDPQRIAASQGVSYVIGNRDKPALVDLILSKISDKGSPARGEIMGQAEGYTELLSRHPMDREWPDPEPQLLASDEALENVTTKTTRSFVKIQDGCDAFCTYCIIPYGRGPSRSVRPREVVARIRELVQGGAREVVLTGTNIGDYGSDWSSEPATGAPQLVELIELILSQTSLERLRLSSLDPTEISPALMALMGREPRLCAHFHVSLQSPHSRILRLMKRRYGFDEVKDCLEAIARIETSVVGGVFVGMDIITGFPGETKEEFEWGVARLRELPWNRLHVFPYSEREGTPATRLPGSVPQAERVRRTRILNELSFERMERHHQSLLNRQEPLNGVLLERAPKGPKGVGEADQGALWVSGYTSNYIRVFAPAGSPEELRNQVVSIRPETLSLDPAGGDAALVGQFKKSSSNC
ncbi:MAG: MiaB/RimO family radical SAM methylthiotransferase [Oligoflexia bacterium]|nr:MiaB/RimO family radical SAM methylthiotransferase [Oligoflexia bacterium]